MEAPAPVLAAVGMLVLDSAELSARALRATAAAGCGRADAAGAARRNATSSSATTTCLRVLHVLIHMLLHGHASATRHPLAADRHSPSHAPPASRSRSSAITSVSQSPTCKASWSTKTCNCCNNAPGRAGPPGRARTRPRGLRTCTLDRTPSNARSSNARHPIRTSLERLPKLTGTWRPPPLRPSPPLVARCYPMPTPGVCVRAGDRGEQTCPVRDAFGGVSPRRPPPASQRGRTGYGSTEPLAT